MKVSNGVSQNTDAIQLIAQFSDDDGNLTTSTVIDHYAPAGDVAWTKLKGYLHAPAASTSTHVALQLRVSANAIAGQIWFDDAELVLA
jgi:hypothetical protein